MFTGKLQSKLVGGLLACLALCGTAAGVTPEEVRTFAAKGADFLLTQQDTNSASPTYGAFRPTLGGAFPALNQDTSTGRIGLGLVGAYKVTGDTRYLNGAILAGHRLRARTGDFAPADPLFLVSLSPITGDVQFRDFARLCFFEALQAGTYVGEGHTHDTNAYLLDIRASHAGMDANLKTWDLSPMVRAAATLNYPSKSQFRSALEDSMDAIYPGKVRYLSGGAIDPAVSRLHDEWALAAGLLALREIGDPRGYVSAGTNGFLPGRNLSSLADAAVGFQIGAGAFAGAWPDITTGDIVPAAPPLGDTRATAATVEALSSFAYGAVTPPGSVITLPPGPGLPPVPYDTNVEVALTAEAITAACSIRVISMPPGGEPPGFRHDEAAIDAGFAFLQQMQLDSGQEVTPLPVPEPATLSLLALGGLVALARRRRRK